MNPRKLLHENTPGAYTQLPLVEIYGDKRVLIENHKGVCSYSPSKIQVRGNANHICVSGRNLCILHMTKYRLVIRGFIENVVIMKGEHGR